MLPLLTETVGVVLIITFKVCWGESPQELPATSVNTPDEKGVTVKIVLLAATEDPGKDRV